MNKYDPSIITVNAQLWNGASSIFTSSSLTNLGYNHESGQEVVRRDER